tara:strand:- start:172 stop:1035 length:864 start_codon:yes stop_codon:yes gene_type:complete
VWEAFIKHACNGTFMHTRTFLERTNDYEDASVLIYKDRLLIAVLPASKENNVIYSHNKATFGGLVYNNNTRGNDIVDIFKELKQYYNLPIIYRAVPKEFHKIELSDDIWALHTLKAERIACELSPHIKKQSLFNYTTTTLENYSINRINRLDYSILDVWKNIVIPNYAKLDLIPVHSGKDIGDLYRLFPNNIDGYYLSYKNKMISALVLFEFNNCAHVQYSASNSKGRALKGLDMLHRYYIKHILKANKIYNFGKCTEQNGNVLNEGLYNYKNKFNTGSLVYESYEY